jgi:short-subunit dehydrogenase
MATALITGATAGIGAAFARALAARGDDLVLVARDAERLAASAQQLREAYGVEVEVLPADLSVRADVMRVAARLEDAERPVEVLVNNAGFGLKARLLDADVSEHAYAMDVMCLTVLILGGAAGRAMRGRGHGRIINVSSLAAWIALGHYSAIKAWVKTYSEGLANELHGTGVTVTALCPGWVRTEFHDRAGMRTSGIPDRVWVDADRCATEALADAERGRVISVPTKRWKTARLLNQLVPRSAIRRASRILTSSRE